MESISNKKLIFFVPYNGLTGLMEQIPKSSQGVISNGFDNLQNNKLLLLGLLEYINPDYRIEKGDIKILTDLLI